jgi:hypothetical protein
LKEKAVTAIGTSGTDDTILMPPSGQQLTNRSTSPTSETAPEADKAGQTLWVLALAVTEQAEQRRLADATGTPSQEGVVERGVVGGRTLD